MILFLISNQDPGSLVFYYSIYIRNTTYLGCLPFFIAGILLLISSLIEVIVKGDMALEAKLKVPKIITLVVVIALFVINLFLLILSIKSLSISLIEQITSIIYYLFLIVIVVGVPIITWRLEVVDIQKSKKSLFFRMKVASILNAIAFVGFNVTIVAKFFDNPSPYTIIISDIIGQISIIGLLLGFTFLLFPAKSYNMLLCCFYE